MTESEHDVLIIGAGLAGICLSVSLSRSGFNVCLVEKEKLPYHKVCGEYVSNECLIYLKNLGFDPFEHGAKSINKLAVSSPKGNLLNMPLDLGGFGISRYKLDKSLLDIASASGVEVHTGEKVSQIRQAGGHVEAETAKGSIFKGKILAGAFGKRSILDKSLDRDFLRERSPYAGVKYHLKLPLDENLISLHNFQGGYAGISAIEDEKACFCYLASTRSIRSAGGIKEAEEKVLARNPFIREIFEKAEFLWEKPMAISEVSFLEKEKSMERIFFLGDSAGMVAPLFGNGMAMAIRSASLLSSSLQRFFNDGIELRELRSDYESIWQSNFRSRMKLGRLLQRGFGRSFLTENLIALNKTFPFLAKKLIKASHGKPF